jgi:two-component system, OmpR family, response regulator
MPSGAGHIIVVDDDPALRQMVTKYLEDYHVPAMSVSSRTELNRHFEGSHPSLIILDLRLGQDDGLDLLRELRTVRWRKGRYAQGAMHLIEPGPGS